MKKLIYLFIITLCFSSTSLFAQKKHTNIYNNQKFESTDYTIELDDIVAVDDICKLRIKVSNKSQNYLLFKPSECNFVFDHGAFQPKEREMLLNPGESGVRVLNLRAATKTDNRFHSNSFKLEIKGIYFGSTKGTPIQLDNFNIPQSTNSVSAENVECVLKNVNLETDISGINFSCLNKGYDYIILDESKIQIQIPSGELYANESRAKAKLIAKNESAGFLVMAKIARTKTFDMQFNKMVLIFNDAVSYTSFNSSISVNATFEVDVEKTKAKNKK